MDPHTLYPTCVLRVNVGCCKACVVNLNKLLSKIDGVYAVDIDAETSLVTVSGKVDPEKLIEKIAKKKKKAEVVSYEEPKPNLNAQNKESKNNKTGKDEKKNCHHNKGKKDYFCPEDSDLHHSEDYVPPKEFKDIECRDPYCRFHHKKPIMNMVKFQPPLNRPRYPPPTWAPQYPPYYREDLLENRPRRQRFEPIGYNWPPPSGQPQYDPSYYCPWPPQQSRYYGY